jgi:hypothetical protein
MMSMRSEFADLKQVELRCCERLLRVACNVPRRCVRYAQTYRPCDAGSGGEDRSDAYLIHPVFGQNEIIHPGQLEFRQ